MFAMLYYYMGFDFGGHPDSNHGDGDDYMRYNDFMHSFFYSYRTSIGDLEAPNAKVWDNQIINIKFMVYLSWFIWMFQQYYILIIFLNFLIAIVGKVYEMDLVNTLQNDFK